MIYFITLFLLRIDFDVGEWRRSGSLKSQHTENDLHILTDSWMCILDGDN